MSDPSSFNLSLEQGVTSDMLIGLKPAAPRSYRISQAPLNASTFAPGSKCIIELPTWPDQSQSYLKFSVQVERQLGEQVFI
jgi:hypothetical protein